MTINFEEATLCECCECNPINHPPSFQECGNVINDLHCKYCRFDNIQKKDNKSVDCLKLISKKDILALIEIKNKPSSTLIPEQIKGKIIDTISYLIDEENDLAQKKKLFLLCLSEQKQPRNKPRTFNKYFFEFGKLIMNNNIKIFNGRYIKFSINSVPYCVFSKIILCSETEAFFN